MQYKRYCQRVFYQKCCENKAEKSPMRLEKSPHMGEDSAGCGARLIEKSFEEIHYPAIVTTRIA